MASVAPVPHDQKRHLWWSTVLSWASDCLHFCHPARAVAEKCHRLVYHICRHHHQCDDCASCAASDRRRRQSPESAGTASNPQGVDHHRLCYRARRHGRPWRCGSGIYAPSLYACPRLRPHSCPYADSIWMGLTGVHHPQSTCRDCHAGSSGNLHLHPRRPPRRFHCLASAEPNPKGLSARTLIRGGG